MLYKDLHGGDGMCLELNDGFYNNTVMYTISYGSDCFAFEFGPDPGSVPKIPDIGAGWEVHDNHVYSQSGQTLIVCNQTLPLETWIAQGHDHGTTTSKWPADDELISTMG